MSGLSPVSLFRRMLTEEFRMHSHLFGPRRFAAFPFFIAAVVGAGVWLLSATDTSLELIVGGLFVLVLFAGFQVGTIGLVGRDAIQDVIGDMTLLVFSARTLPVSRRRLLFVFLFKDLLYYVALFLTPVVVGFLPVVVDGGFTLAEVGLLWVTVADTFALGIGTSLALAGVASRSTATAAGVIALLTAAVTLEPDLLLSLSPYALYADPGVETVLSGSVLTVGAVVVGPLLFEPPTRDRVQRVGDDRYRQFQRFGDALTARPLVEVTRSSGSVWKVVFSLGVLFGVTTLLLDRITAAMGIDPSAGIAFGTLLGLGTFTTYNWVTQNDSDREYLRYPERMRAVFAGKRRAFFLLALPTGLVYLALAGVLFPGLELLLGVVVFPLLAVYVFGLTAYMTGLSPNELLFNTPLFALYSLGLMLVAVPLLTAALAFDEWPVAAAGLSVALAVVGAAVGAVLARRTGPRWHDRLRAES
ncbi:MAG: hypothetical protein J07HX64_01008 [halophilic archaeon J07HX64]|nr:MAG: hypothetical protein J07HX64_01008 [halophilic archaeon J07HX64]